MNKELMGLRDRIKEVIKIADLKDVISLRKLLKDYDSEDGINPGQINLLHKYGLKV